MANRNLNVRISATDEASPSFKRVGDSAQTMGQMIEQAGKSGAGLELLSQQINQLDSELREVGQGLTAMGAVGSGLFGLATKSSMDFTAAMSNVNSIARLSQGELSSMEATILSLASAYGAMPTDLAEGLYDIIGSGFEDAAEAAGILEAAVVAAGAGMTNTATAVQAITAVLNAYGMEADQAGNVSDVLFKTVDSGVLTFEALAKNLGNTIPLASNLGVSIEELGAAYAELTLQGIGASQAETQIAALMRSALAPTEALTEAVREYGYESAEALIAAEGLAGFLQMLNQSAGGSSAALMELVGTQEAMNAALALSRNEGENFTAMLDTMGTAASDGAYTLEVFGIQMDNAAGSVKAARAELEVAAIGIGQSLEPLVGIAADTVAGLAGAFNSLSEPAQGAVTTFGAIASAALLLQGGIMLTIPKIVQFRQALATLQNAGGILATIARFASPATLALGGLAAAGVFVYQSLQDQKAAAAEAAAQYEALQQAVVSVDDAIRSARLGGDFGLAADMQQIANETRDGIRAVEDELRAGVDSWNDIFMSYSDDMDKEKFAQDLYDGLRTSFGAEALRFAHEQGEINDELFNEILTAPADQLPVHATVIKDAMKAYYDAFLPTDADKAAIETELQGLFQILNNPNIDTEALWATWDELYAKYITDPPSPNLQGFVAAWNEAEDAIIAAGVATDETAEAAERVVSTLGDLRGVIGDLPTIMDDLRLEGRFDVADMIAGIETELIEAFNDVDASQMTLALWDEIKLNLTPDELEQFGDSFSRIMDGISDDALDGGAIWADFLAILNNTEMTTAQQLAALDALSTGLSAYRDSAKAMREDQQEFLSDGDNLLAWWENYNAAVSQGAVIGDGTAGALARTNAELRQLESFGGLIDMVQDLEAAGAALDSVLATFDRIDSLGSRSASAGSIAENLVGPPGEWAAIDDLLASGAIKLDQYYDVVESGYAIQDSNARVQAYLNEMRADQLPLLEEEQRAYEAQIRALTDLGPLEQRRALALQDSAVQSQIASLYSTAYAASLGEIPENVATELIANAANADPVVKDLLLQFGLIEEGAEGEIIVNFPDADATVSSINRMTIAFLEMEAAARGMTGVELAVELYGEEEAHDLYDFVVNADGTVSEVRVATVTSGEAEARAAIDGVLAADGTEAVIGVNVNVGDSVQTVDWVYERVVNADGTEAYMVLRADAETGELEDFGRIVESYTDEEQVTHIRVETDDGSFWTTIDLLTGDIGETATIDVVADVSGVETELITLADGTVIRVPVEVDTEGWENYTSEQLRDMIAPEGVEVQLVTKPPYISDEEWQSVAPGTPINLEGEVTDVTVGDGTAGPEVPPIPAEAEIRTVTVVQSALNAVRNALSGAFGGGEDEGPTVEDQTATVTVNLVDNATEGLLEIGSTVGGLDAASAKVLVSQSGAEEAISQLGGVTSAATAIPEAELVNVIIMGAGEGASALDAVTASANAIPEAEMVNVFVFGASAAESALYGVANAAAAIPESVSTTITTNLVTVRSERKTRHGGQLHYAAGGLVTFEAGEAGPEIAHFAAGGSAIIPEHGLYAAPVGTVISPNNTYTGPGGLSVNVTVQGNVYGIDDLVEATTRAVAPALGEVASNIFREQGVQW